MKIPKCVYWLSTIIFSLWMLANAIAYLTSKEALLLCKHFGFPDYFRMELAFAKIIGTIVLLFPFIHYRIKEWAYAGFTLTIVSGFIAHICSGDGIISSGSLFVALLILFLSYVSYHHLKNLKNEHLNNI